MKNMVLIALAMILSLNTVAFGQTPEEIVEKCGEAPYYMTPIEIYSVFSESAKNKDYFTALLYGPWLVCSHPKTMADLPSYEGWRTFDKMIDVYSGYGLTQKDPSMKTAYLDSAIQMYDLMLETFTNEEYSHFKIHRDRGRFFQKNSDFIENSSDKAYNDYEKMIYLDPKEATEQADGYYVQVTLTNMVGKGRKDDALKLINTARPFANDNLLTFFSEQENKLFKGAQERIEFLNSKLTEDPKNFELLAELYDLYTKENMVAESKATARKMYEINPSFDNIRRMGDNAEKNANYTEAIKFFKEALEKADNDTQKKEMNNKIAENYVNLEDLKTARNYARAASKIDASWGQPYLTIAKIYSQAISSCGQIQKEDKVVYWLVLDYLEKAKSVDSSVKSFAEQQIRSISSVTPSTEEKFFNSWNPGDKLKVDGSLKSCYDWINETTTVR